MARTAAERKREQREREADAAKQSEDALTPFLSSPFPEHWRAEDAEQDVAFIAETLGSVGLDYLDFSQDADPELEQGLAGVAENRGALGKAERAVDAMLDGASALAAMINRYKLAEVEKALARIAASDLTDPAAKEKALHDVVLLEGLKRHLTKQVRRSISMTTTRGGAL